MTVQKVEIKKSFKVCPNCGYRDGFHIMLERKGKKRIAMKLICPSCSVVFDAGLQLVSE